MKRHQKTHIQDEGCKNITNGPSEAGCHVIFANGYMGSVEARWVGALKWKIEDYNKSQIQSRIE
jgi:hypothetical protein